MDIRARNKQFFNFMKSVYPDVELYGSIHRPKPVIKVEDKYYVLPCYVHNYYLMLLDKVVDGTELDRLRLQWDVNADIKDRLQKWVAGDPQTKRCYFIRMTEDEAYLNETTLREGITSDSYEASFSFSDRKIFLNYKDALEELEKLPSSKRSSLIIV